MSSSLISRSKAQNGLNLASRPADAGTPGARRMALRLQYGSAAFSHRLACASDLRRNILTATVPWRCAPQWLRALAYDQYIHYYLTASAYTLT
jgi:hypothetical protein